MDKNDFFRAIPKVDTLLERDDIKGMIAQYGREPVMEAIRSEMEALREYIKGSDNEAQIDSRTNDLAGAIGRSLIAEHCPNVISVINATGTILHTNLGRAPLGQEHMKQVLAIASGYSNLEYDLSKGERGERYAHFEKLLCKLTGAEAAMAVNNNAAAVMLILNTMAKGGEVIVSRGELVEIGGKFRIPDVMEQSGAVLKEVGTTNKTHLQDYADGVSDQTKALLKVHTSNYKIVGFTDSVEMEALIPLKEKYDLPLIEDLGSGVLIDLSKYGLTREPMVQDSIRQGADVVCFSGDKLLGGPQAGIIIGKKKYIDAMKRNQMTRALRIDKFTATALELVLLEYLSEAKAVQNIPVLRMITKPLAEIEEEAKAFGALLTGLPADIRVEPCESQIGGGSLPLERLPSMAVSVKPTRISVSEFEAGLRHTSTPIITRTVNDRVLFDLRTMGDEAERAASMIKELILFQDESM